MLEIQFWSEMCALVVRGQSGSASVGVDLRMVMRGREQESCMLHMNWGSESFLLGISTF